MHVNTFFAKSNIFILFYIFNVKIGLEVMDMSLGANIKKFRAIHNIKQQELANMLNMSRATVALWENDKREPQNKELKKMAEIFSIPVDVLLSDTPVFF